MKSDKLPQALDVMKSRWQENFVNSKLSSMSKAISSENTAAHCKRLGYFNCLIECAAKSTPFVWLIKLFAELHFADKVNNVRNFRESFELLSR